jgi:hypothetical protein
MAEYAIPITTDVEATEEEKRLVEDAFGDDFEVTFDSQIRRFSEDQLLFLINFIIDAIESGILYDLIKSAIIRLLGNIPAQIKRGIIIEMVKNRKLFFVSKRSDGITFGMQSASEYIKFENLDELFDKLQED